MRWQPITIPVPVGGVSETWTPTDQPPLTMPAALNVRAFDAATGRTRLAQRSGTSKFCSAQLNGSNAVQAIATVQKHEDRLGSFAVHAAASSVTIDWSARLHAKAATLAGDNLTGIAVDPVSGDLYALAGDTGLIRLNDAGEEQYLHPVQLRLVDLVCKDVKLDGLGNAYVCVAGGGTDGVIHKYRITDDGFEKQWTITAPNGGLFSAIAVGPDALYACENVSAPNSYVHRWEGLDNDTPQLVWSKSVAQAGADIELGPDGVAYVSFLRDGTTLTPMVKKYNPAGEVVWTFQPAGQGGHGYGAVYWEGYLYTVGARLNGLGAWTDNKTVRRLRDDGSSVTSDWTLDHSSAPETTFESRSIAVDEGGGLWRTINSGSTTDVLQRITSAGAVSWTMTTATADVGEPDRIAIDPEYPPGETVPQFIYVGGTKRSSDTKALFKLKVGAFGASITDSSPRSTVRLGVCNGSIVKFTTGSVSTPTGGSGALNTSARFVKRVTAFNSVFFTDGDTYKVYDSATDAVETWRATKGRIPRWCKLLCLHSGRVYLAGDAANPQQWYASGFGDPYDWDFFPVDPLATQAVSGADPRVGSAPDVVNALVSVNESLLVFGCDHSIHGLIGDPADGGRFEVISTVTGMAFGIEPAKAPDGRVFFFSPQGGVYVLAGGSVERLRGRADKPGENAVDARLNAIDLTTNRVLMAWNDAERTLHVFVTPYSQGTTTHYVWDDRHRSWWMDQLPAAQGPTAVEVSDGDLPADRVLLLGGFDGYVRKWDSSATSDDGTAMSSYAVLGPMLAGELTNEFVLSKLIGVVADVTGGQTVQYEAYAAEDPDWANVGSASFSGTWTDGRNDTVHERARGHACFLKVGRFAGSQAVGRWAMESLAASVAVEGMVRNR